MTETIFTYDDLKKIFGQRVKVTRKFNPAVLAGTTGTIVSSYVTDDGLVAVAVFPRGDLEPVHVHVSKVVYEKNLVPDGEPCRNAMKEVSRIAHDGRYSGTIPGIVKTLMELADVNGFDLFPWEVTMIEGYTRAIVKKRWIGG